MGNRALSHLRLGSALVALLLGAAVASPAADAAKPLECASCHDQVQKLAKSAHAGLTCDTCHEGHERVPHPANLAKPACTNCHQDEAGDYAGGVHGQAVRNGNAAAPDCSVCHGSAHELISPESEAFRAKVPETCGMCHSEEARQYQASVHGQAVAHGVTQAPVCADCHGEHKILKPTNAASPVNTAHIRDTCGACHGNVRLTRRFGLPQDRLVSFDNSFHGLAAKAGSQTVANCASCHGVHNILPSSDPRSTINAKNLPTTCGKCHPGAGTRFGISQVHVVESVTAPPALRWVREFYLLVIPVTIGLMMLHNGGDWIRKLIRLRFRVSGSREPAHAPVARREMVMLPFERLQHALLAISFCLLVWTGFALKYPEGWWARPWVVLETSWPVRGVVHRIAAVVLLAVAAMHLLSLALNRRLRDHWKLMLPKAADLREALSNFAYNLGLGSRAPVRSTHSYVGKAEYWALVWGTVVMAVSGIALWANNLVLKLLPKSWLDVATSIHFYEAVLAASAIVVWHFYSIIFDPDVYPLDTAFLTGFRTEHQPARPVERLPEHSAGERRTREAPAPGD